jgi:hypothetical protein
MSRSDLYDPATYRAHISFPDSTLTREHFVLTAAVIVGVLLVAGIVDSRPIWTYLVAAIIAVGVLMLLSIYLVRDPNTPPTIPIDADIDGIRAETQRGEDYIAWRQARMIVEIASPSRETGYLFIRRKHGPMARIRLPDSHNGTALGLVLTAICTVHAIPYHRHDSREARAIHKRFRYY